VPKFRVGAVVRDTRFRERHKILRSDRGGDGVVYYYVENLSGPGAYEGKETWEESQLEAISK